MPELYTLPLLYKKYLIDSGKSKFEAYYTDDRVLTPKQMSEMLSIMVDALNNPSHWVSRQWVKNNLDTKGLKEYMIESHNKLLEEDTDYKTFLENNNTQTNA